MPESAGDIGTSGTDPTWCGATDAQKPATPGERYASTGGRCCTGDQECGTRSRRAFILAALSIILWAIAATVLPLAMISLLLRRTEAVPR